MWWEGGREGSLYFQAGPQLRMVKFEQSRSLEWISLAWAIEQGGICLQ